MNAADKAAAEALIRLGYKLLLNEIDIGDYVEVLTRVLDRPEKEPRFYQ